MGASQQVNPSVETKSGGAAGAMLNGVDSSMKNLKISLDTQHSAHVLQKWQNNAFVQNGPSYGNPIQMIPQGTNLPQVPFVDNFSHAQMNLHSGDIPLLSQQRMTMPFYAHNPYYHSSQIPGVLTPPYGIDGHGLPASFLTPFMTNFAPQLPVMTPFNTPLTPSFSGKLAGFPLIGNIAAGTEYLDPFKIYEQHAVTMLSSLPDLSLIHHFQQPMYHYGHGNPYDTVSFSSNFVGNHAPVFGSENVTSETMHQSGQKFQFPNTGACSSPATKKGGSYVGNHQSTSPYMNMPMPYPTSPVFQNQPLSGTYNRGRRNDAPALQSSSKTMVLSPGIQGQRGREKTGPNSCSFLVEVKSDKTHIVELSNIRDHIVEYMSVAELIIFIVV
jgi:pumilio RNA-binding family